MITDTQPSPAFSARDFPASSDGASKRVLVVDDEETVTDAVARFLRTRGYEVETAGSGEDALAALGGGHFVAMLCDVRMPGISGVETVPRALRIDPDLAILMLTGVNDAPTATSTLSSGALDYLLKPVELPNLHQAIERALHRRGLEIDRRAIERVIREEVVTRTEELEAEKHGAADAGHQHGRVPDQRHGSQGRLPPWSFPARGRALGVDRGRVGAG